MENKPYQCIGKTYFIWAQTPGQAACGAPASRYRLCEGPRSNENKCRGCACTTLCDADSGTVNLGFGFGKILRSSAVSRASVLDLWERTKAWARRSAVVMCLVWWSGSLWHHQLCSVTLPLSST